MWVPGAHDATRTIVLRYRVGNMLRFFEEHDELYWNVTGTDWDVPIESATARVVLPAQVTAVVEVFRHLDRSFITPSAGVPLRSDTVLDISHESLIRQWQRLNQWVEQEALSADNYRRLEQTARLWDTGTFALQIGGHSIAAVDHHVSAADLQTELAKLTNISGVTVTPKNGAGSTDVGTAANPWVIRFTPTEFAKVFVNDAAAAFIGFPVSERHAALHQWVARMNGRPSIQRATEEAITAYQQSQSDPNPLFTSARIHWRSDRVEWAVRLGLGSWLLDEITADRAFFSPVP